PSAVSTSTMRRGPLLGGRISFIATALAAILLLVACGTPSVPGAMGGGSPVRADEADRAHARTLVMLVRFEPKTLTARVTTGGDPQLRTALFTAGLAFTDDHDIDHPQVAMALPELNTESWQLSSDGRMQT